MSEKQYLTVKELCEIYSASRWAIYEAIRTDSTFPYINLGKKNYRVHKEGFESWLARQSRQHYIPTAEELLKGVIIEN